MHTALQKIMVLAILYAGCFLPTSAQNSVSFDNTHWSIKGKMEKDYYQGRDCIRLCEGSIYLRDSTFVNGVIEFDMALSQSRYFPGFGFRIQDQDNFENVHLRPHQRGNPDAIQYMPVFNGQDAWQLYYGDGFSTALTYPFEQWVRIKLVIKDLQAEVYVGDQAKPGLVIHHLKRAVRSGKICLTNGSPTIVRYADFKYTKTDNPELLGQYKNEVTPLPGLVTNWQISSTFDEQVLENRFSVPDGLVNKLKWAVLSSETAGIVNMAQVCKVEKGKNTAFAKLTLDSDRQQVKAFQFGFSDKVRLYVNNQLTYSGQDDFMSRDYRFLGTTGYFDQVYLNLKKGKNEILLAITEDFGGWGVRGIIADRTGLTVKP